MHRIAVALAFVGGCVTSDDELARVDPDQSDPAFELYRVPLGTPSVCFGKELVYSPRLSTLTGETIMVLNCYVSISNRDETELTVGHAWCGDDDDCMRATNASPACPPDRPNLLEYLAVDAPRQTGADHAVFSCD